MARHTDHWQGAWSEVFSRQIAQVRFKQAMIEESLFHQALKLPVDERLQFLHRACAGNEALRAAVESLLAAHDAPGSLLNQRPAASRPESQRGTPGGDNREAVTRTDPENLNQVQTVVQAGVIAEGTVIAGRYRLEQKLGEGGMGEVWVARQTEPIKRRVALKLIKTGMDSRGVVARFEQERQALALMDHPNIARVLDGGLTPGGQPFFVMELVNGLPVLRFCDEMRLTPRDRLELFLPICQAVQHAHQKGIVHRDLKPANILVTVIDGRPIPKVIDFGVAKATAGKLTDESLSTQFGAVVGTLEYMAPEQAGFAGEDIDTRADIYSLGVILYELLTGLRPIETRRLKQAALSEMIRIIREEEPSRPSTRLSTDAALASLASLRQTEPNRLMALLRGELDWVVMKCLEKQRDRRYETANGLARDIQRYLSDEPVEARPPSAGYRLSKFLRRHRGPAVAASLVVLALVGGIVGTTLGMMQAEKRRIEADDAHQREAQRALSEQFAREREAEQRLKAEQARDRMRQALDAMTSTVTGDSLSTQNRISEEQKAFLTDVLDYYQEFSGDETDDEQSRTRTAEAAHRVFLIEQRLGHLNEALTAEERSCRLHRQLVDDNPENPAYRQRLALNHNNLGLLLRDRGRLSEAEPFFQKALMLQQELVARFPAEGVYRMELAGTHGNYSGILAQLERSTEADEQCRLGLDIESRLVADFPAVPQYRQRLAFSHASLANRLNESGHKMAAVQPYRKALEIAEWLSAEFPEIEEYRHDVAIGEARLAILLAAMGRLDEAERRFGRGGVIQTHLVAEYPGVTEYRRTLARIQWNLSNLLKQKGRVTEAEQLLRDSQKLLAERLTALAATSADRNLLEGCHTALAEMLKASGKLSEAEEQYQLARAVLELLVAEFPEIPEHQERLAANSRNLGDLSFSRGAADQADRLYRQALRLQLELSDRFPGQPAYRKQTANSHNGLGNLRFSKGRYQEAIDEFRSAVTIEQELSNSDGPLPGNIQRLAMSRGNLGMALALSGQAAPAEAEYRAAIELEESLVRENPEIPQYHEELANNRNSLASLLQQLGRTDESREQHQQALAARERLVTEFPEVTEYQIDLGGSFCNYGMLLRDSGELEESLMWFDRAVARLASVVTANPQLALAREFLLNSHLGRANVFQRIERLGESLPDWDRALELCPESMRVPIRVARVTAYAEAGRVDEAVAEVAELSRLTSHGRANWYNFACVYALASVGNNERQQEYSDRAMELLQKAIAAGFRDVRLLTENPALDPLRPREDFQQLLDKLAGKTTSKSQSP